MLTGPFFMLELYDRVLPSRSVPTLIGLGALAAVLFAFQGLLEWIRGRILVRIGGALDETLSLRVHDALVRAPLKGKVAGDGLQPLRDLDQVRSFLSSPGPMALFDFPWIPFYLGICFLFHVLIGLAATIGGLILVFLTYLTEVRTRGPAKAAVTFAATRNALAEAGRRNAEVLQAMGMAGHVGAVWARTNSKYMASQRRATDVAGGLGALSKVLRLALQSAVLGLGGYLAICQEATAGIIIASSILTARATPRPGWRIGQGGTAEAPLKGIRGGGIREAEADVELRHLMPAAASANWYAALTMEGIKLEALAAEATWWQLELDDVRELPLIHVPSDLELAAGHAYIAEEATWPER